MTNANELHDSDKAVVDFLFDGTSTLRDAAAHNPAAVPNNVDPQRVVALRKLLAQLDHLESVHPPLDLAAKTLARIAVPAAAEQGRQLADTLQTQRPS